MTMLIYAILVFVSVVTLKQHVLIDIIAGVTIAEVCYLISNRTNGYKKLMNVFEKINGLVFGKNEDE